MRVQITRMSGLISDMLTLAKLDHDQDASPTRTVDFSRLVTGCLLSSKRSPTKKGVAIHSQVSEHLLVRGSPKKFSRLVDILLDNAVKHAPTGRHGEHRAFPRKEPRDSSCPKFWEEISAEALPHVFDRFYRADSARSRETGGYGLGLAIAKSIVEGSYGKISVESTNGHTIFPSIFQWIRSSCESIDHSFNQRSYQLKTLRPQEPAGEAVLHACNAIWIQARTLPSDKVIMKT